MEGGGDAVACAQQRIDLRERVICIGASHVLREWQGSHLDLTHEVLKTFEVVEAVFYQRTT